MRVAVAYGSYLRHFSAKYPDAATLDYDRLRRLYHGDAFGTSDAWTAALEALGYETFAVVSNYEPLQRAWGREHGVAAGSQTWQRDIVLAQARHFRPEVVWLTTHDRDLVRALRRQAPGLRLIFQAVGGVLDLSYPFPELDFVISCAPELVATLRRRGVHAHQIHHAFDARILGRLPPGGPPVHDLVFAGQLVARRGFHTGRHAVLARLAAGCPLEIFTSGFATGAAGRLGPDALWRALARPVQLAVAHGLPASAVRHVPRVGSLLDLRLDPAVRPRLRSPVYGLDMFEIFRRSRICLNVHADSSPTHASNLRLYEVAGVGSCLLTDWKANLPDLFEPDRDVVAFRTPDECVEKVRWLLAHPAEREAIARAGQQRCLSEHTHRHRVPLLDAVIRETLARLPRPPHGAGLDPDDGARETPRPSPQLGARLRAGLAWLAACQAADGGFPVVVMTGGPGFPSGALSSPFVTGLVLDALRVLGAEFDTGPLVQRALAYLRAEMENGGLLRFYRFDPPLRPDLDSTSVAVRALRGAGVALDYEAVGDRLVACRNMAGRFRTWIEARPSLRQRLRAGPRALLGRWFNPVDPIVNANVVAFLQEIGRTAPGAERFLRTWARRPRALGASPYYLHPECLAYALSKVAEGRPPGDTLRAVTGDLVRRLVDGPPDAGRDRPFLLARRLAAVLRLGLARPDLTAAVETLASYQRGDGSWPSGEAWTAVRWSRGAPRPLLGSPALDTAIALEVLARCPR
jgi:hypothetical protein